jgi:hypothetical protein
MSEAWRPVRGIHELTEPFGHHIYLATGDWSMLTEPFGQRIFVMAAPSVMQGKKRLRIGK